MEGHAQKCVERYCEVANKKVEQLYNVSHPCLDEHHFKKEELESVGELLEVCAQTVLKCLYLARIGRLDILLSVNKLARSVTKWTQACDKRFATFISYIYSSHEWLSSILSSGKHGTTLQTWLIPRLRLCRRLWEFKVNLRWVSCVFLEAEQLSQSVGCAGNKHQFLIAPQGLKLFLWVLDFVWMGYLLLTYRTMWSRCYVQPRTTFNLGTLAQGSLGRSNPTIPSQGHLSVFNKTGQFVNPTCQ